MVLSKMKGICVYAASSAQVDKKYLQAASGLGKLLAENRFPVVYGGGAVGLMGALADAALDAGGRVIGVIPRFMRELEWAHPRATEMKVVEDMHARKKLMLELSDAAVALPGGSGTLDELFEAITWKRLGLFTGPIVLVNVAGYYQHCLALLEQCVAERFMAERHRAMWTAVDSPAGVLDAVRNAPPWDPEARGFAVVR